MVSPRCPNFRDELLSYRWKPDGMGGTLNRPEGEDHLIDALRYAMEGDSGSKAARILYRGS